MLNMFALLEIVLELMHEMGQTTLGGLPKEGLPENFVVDAQGSVSVVPYNTEPEVDPNFNLTH